MENHQEPILIKTWKELNECKSETHVIELCNLSGAMLKSKDGSKNIRLSNDCFTDRVYLTSHTFYGHKHKFSTEILQQCGFNIVLANWDE